MKFRIVARFLSLLISVISVNMFFPLVWALMDGSPDSRAFLLSIAVGAVAAAVLYLVGKKAAPSDMGAREAFAAVALAWVFASCVGALPYLLGGYVPSFTDAFFEAMSGFTTTGATILTNVEANPRGILMWRSQTQWLGGMGIVVLTIALLPMLGVTMTQLFAAESPGPVLEKISPRIQDMATMLWQVYMGLTCVGIVLLMCGGMNFYESICHIFATVSTGGFSTRNASIGAYKSAYFDWVLTIIMFLSGANFNLHLLAVQKRSLRPYRDPEFLFYLKIVAAASLAVAAFIYCGGFYKSVLDSLRFAAFQVVSIITTTGFVTADYSLWPPFTQFALLLLMIIGGCAGSTAGAVKCVRIEIICEEIKSEFRHLIHANATVPIRLGDSNVDRDTAHSAVVFFGLYMLIFFSAMLIVTGTGQDLVTALGAVATTLGNVGPGLGKVGPVYNFESQTFIAKWVYSFCMLCGRLELFTVLVLFSRDTWRR